MTTPTEPVLSLFAAVSAAHHAAQRLIEARLPKGMSAAQYQRVAKVSKATATRHLADLLDKGCLQRLPGGGRSTRYQIRYPGESTH